MNSILGLPLSITSDKAQTTRERINGIYTKEQLQMIFVDTPGIHKAKENGINAAMMHEVREALDQPDLIWYLFDPMSQMKHEEAVIQELLLCPQTPIYLIQNKSDLSVKNRTWTELGSEIEKSLKSHELNLQKTFVISATKKKNVSELMNQTETIIPNGPWLYPDGDQVSDKPMRYFAGEFIREQLFKSLGDEIPYSCAIYIKSYKEEKTITRIEANIVVERDSQKAMVIGQKGQKIKEIGTKSRETLQKFLDQKIFLGLNVVVEKNWTKNPEALAQLGYHLPKNKKK
jgi:GTP-binding protein Era